MNTRPTLNRQWHLAHTMPVHATDEQRAEWHLQHMIHCACRKPTPGVEKLIEDYLSTHTYSHKTK